MTCRRCGADAGVERPTRRDTCPRCGADLRACVQCSFFAPGQYNQCREPQADRVLDAERANYCEYFAPGTGDAGNQASSKDAAKTRLDALFKQSR